VFAAAAAATATAVISFSCRGGRCRIHTQKA
jgi:hypothetical protein